MLSTAARLVAVVIAALALALAVSATVGTVWRSGGTVLARSQRLVVLCPEAALSRLCPDHLVFGIREAKGLEFPDVALVDFFCSLPEPDQRAACDPL